MNEFEVRELFILGALIDSRLPDRDRPARLKSQSLPFVHSFQDVRGWEPSDMSGGMPITKKNRKGEDVEISELARIQIKNATGDKLEYGDRGRRDLEAQNFWDGDRITPRQVTEWERCNELIRLVTRERHRRCLWAWAQGQAKVLRIAEHVIVGVNAQPNFKRKVAMSPAAETRFKRISFSAWCHDIEDIHRNYGKTCADHAIAEITAKLASNALQPNEKGKNCTLQDGAKIRDIRDRLQDQATVKRRDFANMGGWIVRDESKALLRFDEELMHVDLDAQMRKDRRERDRKRRAA